MPLIEWKDEFNVGVPAVDHEHREMVEMINALYATLSQPDSESAVMDFLGEIYAKISAHFALEEKIMREQKYDQFADHKQDHERLLDEIRDIMDSYEDSAAFDERELERHLTAWFTEHFKTRDARLHKHLA